MIEGSDSEVSGNTHKQAEEKDRQVPSSASDKSVHFAHKPGITTINTSGSSDVRHV